LGIKGKYREIEEEVEEEEGFVLTEGHEKY